MQLIYLYTTKLYQSCCWVQSPFIVYSATEIEMKKNSRLISEAPWRALVLLSKDVVEKLWSFVKSYGYENRSRDLVEYTILYSVTPTNSFCFGTMYDVPWTFRNFKKWAIQLTPSKRSAVLLLNWEHAYHIGIKSRVKSGL